MFWPLGWTSLEPLNERTFLDWYEKSRIQAGAQVVPKDGVRDLWWDDDPADSPYRPRSLEQLVRECADSVQELSRQGILVGALGRALIRGDLRELSAAIHQDEGTADDVQSVVCEQSGVESKDASLAYEGERGWAGVSDAALDEGVFVPRVAVGVKERVNRLRALGNGQVPLCMSTAFTYLAREAGISGGG